MMKYDIRNENCSRDMSYYAKDLNISKFNIHDPDVGSSQF